MFVALARPLPTPKLLLAALALCAAVAGYCLAYSALAGRPEPPGQALIWAAVNILPWLFTFEAGKRIHRVGGVVVALAAALTSSVILGSLFDGGAEITFEGWRRVPALMLVAILLLLARLARKDGAAKALPFELPLPPRQIDWVRAAGNYIEIRGAGRTLTCRASLGAAQRALMRHGFVRVHRSTLVRRDRIARVRPADVVLHDGTSLKTGKRYRANLDG